MVAERILFHFTTAQSLMLLHSIELFCRVWIVCWYFSGCPKQKVGARRPVEEHLSKIEAGPGSPAEATGTWL